MRAAREDIDKQIIKLIAASVQPHAGSKAPSPGERRLAAIRAARVAPGVRRMRSLLARERDRSAVSGERGSRFREPTDCNGVEIFPDCFDSHVKKLTRECKFHSCGHDRIFVPLDEQGSLLGMDQNTAHASKNPKTGTCVAASFFFKLGTNERVGRKRQLKLFERGRFNDLSLCDRVARRVLSGWDCEFARFKPRLKYHDEDLTLTRSWTEEEDMKKLEKEFPDLHELQLQAERKFFDMYGTNVTAHSIWFNLKTPYAGGFDKHVDEFATGKAHIGTITVNLLHLQNCLPRLRVTPKPH